MTGADHVTAPPQRVALARVELSFGAMVGLCLKWSLAAIPALLLLTLIGFVGVAILAGLVSGIR